MKYVVAEGNSFTANGHIYSQGEEIPEAVFGDKSYFAKLISLKKILEVEVESTETVEKTKPAKKTKKSKGE